MPPHLGVKGHSPVRPSELENCSGDGLLQAVSSFMTYVEP